jgi:hypothetical protein
MADGSPVDQKGVSPAPANEPTRRGPATRVLLLTTSLTALTLLVISYFFFSHNAQLRATFDDAYSRKSAYLAAEADLRLESFKLLSAAVGSAVIQLGKAENQRQRETANEQDQQAQARLDVAKRRQDLLSKSSLAKTRDRQRAAQRALKSISAADDVAQKDVDARDALALAEQAATSAGAALHAAEDNLDAAAQRRAHGDAVDAGPADDRAQHARAEYDQKLRDYRSAEEARQAAEAKARTATERARSAYAAMEVGIKEFGAADQNLANATAGKTAADVAYDTQRKQVEDIEDQVRKADARLAEELHQAAFAFENKARDDCEGSPPGERRACLAASIVKGLLEAKPGASAVDVVQRSVPPDLPRRAPIQVNGDYGFVPIPDMDPDPSIAGLGSQARYLRIPLSLLVAQGSTVQVRGGSPETLFDEVLLVDGASRRVLYASGTDPLARAVTLPVGEVKDPPTSKYLAAAAPSILEMDLGSQRYLTFERPVSAAVVSAETTGASPASGAGPDGSLVVVGLVREVRLGEQVKGLSPLDFLWAVVVTALAVFAWPLAKLWLVGARTRFSRVDMVVFATSSLAGTLLVALLVMTIAASTRLERRVDTQIGKAATDIGGVLSAAWRDSAKGVDAFITETRLLVNSLPDANGGTVPPAQEVARECRSLTDEQRTARWVHLGKPSDDSPSSFCMRTRKGPAGANAWSSAFWANELGYEQIQSTDGPTETPPVNLGMRDYFQRALASCTDGHKDEYMPEVVRSMTKTTKLLVVARGTCSPKRQGVAAYESDLTRFDLRIPPGLQWAAIDGSGKVMLHSSLDAHHGHDLFEDLDPTAQEALRSAIGTQTRATFAGQYEGAPSRLHVEHNPETGWYVVVIGSLSGSYAIVANTLKTTVVAVGIFAICVGLGTVGMGVWRAWRSSRAGGGSSVRAFDLHPRASEASNYHRAAIVLGAGSAVLLGAALAAGPWTPTLLLLVLSAALLCAGSARVPGVWQAAQAPPPPTDTTDSPTPRTLRNRIDITYVACCWAFAAAAVVVPTVVCFVGAFSAAAQNGLDLEQRALAIRSECDVVPPRSSSCLRVLPNVEPLSPPEGKTELASVPPPSLWSDFLWPMRTVMGLMSSSVLPANSPALACERSGWLGLDLRTPESCLFHSELLHLLGGGNGKTLGELAIAVLATVLFGAAVAFYSIKRMFFLDVLDVRPGSTRSRVNDWSSNSEPGPRRLFILFPSPLPQPPPEALVLSAVDVTEDEKAVTTLVEVERRAASDKALVLAGVDPLRRAPESLRPRWARALAGFTLVRGPGRSNSSPSDASRFDDWNASDADEQRVLAQLAIDGHVSPDPTNLPILRHLQGRGLLDPDTLRIKDPAFAGFVATSVGPDRMRAWEAADTDVAWGILRVPLLTGVGLLVLLVSQIRPELASGGALLIPPLVGGLPAALRLIASMVGAGNDQGAG